MNTTFICSRCGQEFPEEQQVLYCGEPFCQLCFGSETLCCTECGEYIRPTQNAGTEDTPLCCVCFEESYTHCSDCGALLREPGNAYYDPFDRSESTPYCRQCYREHDHGDPIHDYCYKPDPIFYGDGPRYLGVELEIDEGGESASNAASILDIANADAEYLYIKHDGSLDDGMELVTHPMSLEVHLHQMPWREVLKKACVLGYRSHQSGTCGLHIHVSRSAFGETDWEQDAAIARILYFFEKHWDELLKFSRRTQCQLNQWAQRYGLKEHPMDILDHAKKGCHANRYTCVNLQNRETIEFRIFRGTLKYNTLIATLQLIDRICDAAVSCTDQEMKGLAWTSFVAGIQETDAPELVRYLKECRLYVNEWTPGEVEI